MIDSANMFTDCLLALQHQDDLIAEKEQQIEEKDKKIRVLTGVVEQQKKTNASMQEELIVLQQRRRQESIRVSRLVDQGAVEEPMQNARCCFYCGNDDRTVLKRCGGCREVRFCSWGCLKKSWPTHKSDCQVLKKQHCKKQRTDNRLQSKNGEDEIEEVD